MAFDGLNGGASVQVGDKAEHHPDGELCDSEQDEEDDEVDENISSCLSNQPPSSVNAIIASAPAASRYAMVRISHS